MLQNGQCRDKHDFPCINFIKPVCGLLMATVLSNISNIIIPIILFYIVAYGISNHCNVYEDFIKGAKDGFHTVIQIMPTLIGLMVAVGVLRASGFLEFVGGLFGDVAGRLGFSAELVPLMFVKMFSSSAATGLVLDIFKNHGPDSLIGLTTSIMMSCTETGLRQVSCWRERWLDEIKYGKRFSVLEFFGAGIRMGRLTICETALHKGRRFCV